MQLGEVQGLLITLHAMKPRWAPACCPLRADTNVLSTIKHVLKLVQFAKYDQKIKRC